MKDRIGNELAVANKVLVHLPEPQIFGFISQIEEPGLIALAKAGTQRIPGRVLVSCVIALPYDEELGCVMPLVKVYDANTHPEPPQPPERLQ